jgi:hypothetical protein
MIMTKLFLDDIRDAPDNTWAVVRSFDAFKEWIIANGIPDVISFDHDLGLEVPTGMDCAKWIVTRGLVLKSFLVHSANPPGRENIDGLLRNWKRYCETLRVPE